MDLTRIAIVGAGPCGLAALEALISRLDTRELQGMIEVVVFEASDCPGSGPNYAPGQLKHNQLNIPLREIPLMARKAAGGMLNMPAFPSFQSWYGGWSDAAQELIDHYPPRAEVGRYLQARLQSVIDANASSASLRIVECCRVTALRPGHSGWVIATDRNADDGEFDEVLLAIGHQPTETDPVLARWTRQGTVYLEPYPCERLQESDAIGPESVVAIRGMGLSMIDVVKSLTLGRGGRLVTTDAGRFELSYQPSGDEPRLLLPFSLDGQPLAPKPLNKTIDSRFEPDSSALELIESTLQSGTQLSQPDDLLNLIQDLVARISASIYQGLLQSSGSEAQAGQGAVVASESTLSALAREWLIDEKCRHRLILARNLPAPDQLEKFLQMATGEGECSLDYCIGQVWRHLQPVFYRTLRFDRFPGEAIAPVLNLHERMKRYSFGPPAVGAATLLALVKAGLLKFRIADDPDIEMSGGHWLLHDGDDRETAHVMVNTVLDSPVLTRTDSPLVNDLKRQLLIEPIHEHLGAKARDDGRLIHGAPSSDSLCACGRLITGSIFEGDALDSCFGGETAMWARGIAQRNSLHAAELVG